MKFEYWNTDGSYRYEFIFQARFPGYVEIRSYERGCLGGNAWLHAIKDGKIIWRNDDFMRLSEEAKDYAINVVARYEKLKAFW